MSSLGYIEKAELETILRMHDGYVLDFSNKQFADFFSGIVDVDIFSEEYAWKSGSKANRMRAFLSKASDQQVVKVLEGLLKIWGLRSETPLDSKHEETIRATINTLSGHKLDNAGDRGVASKIDSDTADGLRSCLVSVSNLDPHKRGFAFERFLNDLFNAYGMAARASFRLVGEQIDGSFRLHHEIYLLEAKWQAAPTNAADLRNFQGKLNEKADWTRGLFLSYSGFSTDGLVAFGRAKRLVCMDGRDLSEVLGDRLSFIDVLDAKIRHASETGEPYVSIRDLKL